jgi:uncharacterized GH25 family protein
MNRTSFFLVVLLVLSATGNAFAHDFFIMPDKFRVSPGDVVKIGIHSSDAFPESSTLPQRARDAAYHSTNGPAPIQITAEEKRMVGQMTVPAGHVIVTAVNAASIENMRAASFHSYLEEEGLSGIVEARKQRGEAESAAREIYTMYGKTILLSGQPNNGHGRVVGLPIEIVPERDPYTLKSGESLPVRVLFRDAPVSGVQMMAATAGESKNQTIGRTDAQGRISVPMKSGQWRLHAVHMERVTSADAEWESFWATLTFEIP